MWLRLYFPGGKVDRRFPVTPSAGDRVSVDHQGEYVELVVKHFHFEEDDGDELRCSAICELAKVRA